MSDMSGRDDRRYPHGHCLLPCLLHDVETSVALKAVMLDVSGVGCRVFTNDRRVRLMDPERLVGRTFRVEFDYYDLDTGAVVGKVINMHPGKDPLRERQLGLEFIDIDPVLSRDINRLVLRDNAAVRKHESAGD